MKNKIGELILNVLFCAIIPAICLEGVYLNMTNRSCELCPQGFYKDKKNLDTYCQPCPSGFTTENMGGTNSGNCSLSKYHFAALCSSH